jgi:hypothetical protein
MMTKVEQLYEVGSKLPPTALAELLDFAEFLQQKCIQSIPPRHELLEELKGGLENSSTFAGSPLSIQEKMRSEWD